MEPGRLECCSHVIAMAEWVGMYVECIGLGKGSAGYWYGNK